MKKFILLFIISTVIISCDDKNADNKIPGSTMYEEILPVGRVDTSLIRFVFENEGNSKLTGKVKCSNKIGTSAGEYFKYSNKPLSYYFQNTLELNKKNVVYYQIDSLTSDTFRIKVTFPDTTQVVNSVSKVVKDSLVYKAFKKPLSTFSF